MGEVMRKRYTAEFKSEIALEAIKGMAASFPWKGIFYAMSLLG